MTTNKLNYCPYCGKKIQADNVSKINYCCFCGSKLKKEGKSPRSTVQCTICHKYIGLKRENTIKCSYCGSKYHSTCISSWLLKYNSCPMCLNEFLMPKSMVIKVEK
ncbi:MAG: RING finger domain-containing protein [Promethearchaeota archaeon]